MGLVHSRVGPTHREDEAVGVLNVAAQVKALATRFNAGAATQLFAGGAQRVDLT